jgi:transposase
MAEILAIRHERIDDVPLIIGTAKQLRMIEIFNRRLGTHGLQQGLHNGQLTVGWLAYILSQADHRKSAVRDWANDLSHTLGQLLGQPLRDVDFSDDRLGGVAHRLSDDAAWEAIEQDLWAATLTVYHLPLSGVRLDSTTSYGYHQPQENGLMQQGHSKDHRPDLAQLKLMAAAAEPWGQVIACDVKAGQCADDPLYTPLIQRVRRMVGHSGLLYTGDCKMAALSTRAELVANNDYYLMPLPMTGETAEAFTAWIDAAIDDDQPATLVWDGADLLGAGYEFERIQTTTHNHQTMSWRERVLVVRSRHLAQTQAARLEQRMTKAIAALQALTPPVARGKRQIRDEATLRQAITAVLERYDVKELLQVSWKRDETTVTRYHGRGRGGPQRPQTTHTRVRYMITGVHRNLAAITARQHRLGWRVQATNAPIEQLSLSQAVLHYRGGWTLERDFHLVKDLPLGLSPLFVWKDEQIKGLTRLLTLALRLLTLIESQVRQGQAQSQELMTGLYEGQPNRTTDRPTGKRILKAFARAKITLTCIETSAGMQWHLTPLSPLHQQILRYLRLPASLYAVAFYNST